MPALTAHRPWALLVALVLVTVGVAVLTREAGAARSPLAADARDAARHGLRLIELSIGGRDVRRPLETSVVVPLRPGPAHRPLLLFLHGHDRTDRSFLDDAMFTALAAQGRRAPIVAFPDGGRNSYWYDRGSGQWARYVMHEVLPRVLARVHANPRRVAIGGISMGGFGALNLVRLNRGRFCAVGADSAAISVSRRTARPGAFPTAAAFARNDIVAVAAHEPAAFRGLPIWLDVGTGDAFRAADDRFARLLRADGIHVRVHHWPGGHDLAYWDAHWRSYFRFYAGALSRCSPGRMV